MRKLWVLGLAVFTCILVLSFAAWGEVQKSDYLCSFDVSNSFPASLRPRVSVSALTKDTQTEEKLPPLQPHPLPPSLAQWQDSSNSGDYFKEVKPTPAGFLVWSEFPIKVFVEPEKNSGEVSVNAEKAKKWIIAALEAIKEWNVYLPLEVVEDSTIADILIWRSAPAWKPTFDRNTGRFQLPRARTAEARYQFYRRQSAKGETVLSQRVTIHVNPNQVTDYILPSIRHELGHALGIWGHSPVETDALYFSQVRNPSPISQRDVNTLKKIYQQPTRLGWKL